MSKYPRNNANMVACAIIVDCSGSMGNVVDAERSADFTRMNALSLGLDEFSNRLKADTVARNSVDIAVIDVGGQDAQRPTLVQDWVLARDFIKPNLVANGSTPIGEALLMGLDLVERKKRQYRNEGRTYCRPWIIVISDGEKTDDARKWEEAVQAAQRAIKGNHALIMAIGIDDCDLAELSEISTEPARPLSAHRFQDFFLWLSGSLKQAGSSRV